MGSVDDGTATRKRRMKREMVMVMAMVIVTNDVNDSTSGMMVMRAMMMMGWQFDYVGQNRMIHHWRMDEMIGGSEGGDGCDIDGVVVGVDVVVVVAAVEYE